MRIIRDGARKGPPSRDRFAATLALATLLVGAGLSGAESPPGTPASAVQGFAARLPEAVAEAQKTVEGVRGVTFRGKVASAILPEKDLPAILDRKLVEDLPVSFERYAASLEALGLIDFEPELRKRLTRLYARQVAGFYDPDEKKFYVVPERRNEAADVPGLGITGASLMEDVLLTHELTHALQDQRLHLKRLMKSLKESTDALMALQCVLEGEATVVMTEALISRLPPEARGALGSDGLSKMVAGLAAGDSSIDGAEGVPDYFVKELVFPYVAGTAWIEKKRASGGWAAVDAAYTNLPATTSEIIHPERGGLSRARLSDGEIPGPKDLPAGTRRLYSDTLGEWTLRMLLERAEVSDLKTLAAEWQDDRILFFEPKGRIPGPVGFVWRIRCLTSAGARKLGGALTSFYEVEGASDATVVTTGDLVEVTRRKAPPRPAPETPLVHR